MSRLNLLTLCLCLFTLGLLIAQESDDWLPGGHQHPAPSTGAHALAPLILSDSIGVFAFCGPVERCGVYNSAWGVREDGVVGRQWYQGVAAAAYYRNKGLLGSTVVTELGTNGPITMSDVDAMMQELKGVKRIFAVTCFVSSNNNWTRAFEWCSYGLGYGVNAVLAAAAKKYHRLKLIRWDLQAYKYVSYPDGTHPDSLGSYTLASMIHKAVYG